MGMSSGANDGLFRLAEKAAPEEGRIMPSERKYLKSNKTVSLNDAISLMKQRRNNPDLKIKGGLDDNSQEVRKNFKIDKNKQAQTSSSVTKIQVISEENDEKSSVQTRARKSNSDVFNGLIAIQSQIQALSNEVTEIKSSVSSIKSKSDKLDSSANSVNEDSKVTEMAKDKLKDFRAGNHKVTFLVNEMEFTVKCLDIIRDEYSHCLVLVFSEDGDSFFIPPKQTELQIKYDDQEEPGKLFYFGMFFHVKQLGLRFLGFLYDNAGMSDDNAVTE